MDQRVTAKVQRVSQVYTITSRLNNGVFFAVVTGLFAVVTQMETQGQVAMLLITVTSSFLGFQRSKSYKNGKRCMVRSRPPDPSHS